MDEVSFCWKDIRVATSEGCRKKGRTQILKNGMWGNVRGTSDFVLIQLVFQLAAT